MQQGLASIQLILIWYGFLVTLNITRFRSSFVHKGNEWTNKQSMQLPRKRMGFFFPQWVFISKNHKRIFTNKRQVRKCLFKTTTKFGRKEKLFSFFKSHPINKHYYCTKTEMDEIEEWHRKTEERTWDLFVCFACVRFCVNWMCAVTWWNRNDMVLCGVFCCCLLFFYYWFCIILHFQHTHC